jgi:hypothetical protein
MKNIEERVELAVQLVATETGFSLNFIQKVILRESLLEDKKTYAQIAEENNYSESYIKFTLAPKLWQLLSQAIGEKVNKTNLPPLLEQHLVNQNNLQATETTTAMSGVGLTAEHYVLESPEGQVPLASDLYVE